MQIIPSKIILVIYRVIKRKIATTVIIELLPSTVFLLILS